MGDEIQPSLQRISESRALILNECPHHEGQKLEVVRAESENFFCDMCHKKLHKGEEYWSCPQCHWDKCQWCKDHGIEIEEGMHVEVIRPMKASYAGDPVEVQPKTMGRVLSVGTSSSGRTASISFTHSYCLSTEEEVEEKQFENLIVVQEPKSHTRMIVGLILIFVLFVLGMVFHKRISVALARFIAFCKTLGLWSALLIMAVCSLLPVIMMPVFPMMALSGPLFTEIYDGNPWIGGSIAFACVFTGLWNGSVIAFALGKTCFKETAEHAGAENKYMQRLNKIIDRGGIKIVFMARSLPILPAEVFDYAVAVTSLQTWQYAVGCFGSAVPVAFWCYSTAQATVGVGEDEEGSEAPNGGANKWLLIALNLAAVVVLTVVIVYTIKHAEHDANHIVDRIVESNPDIQKAKTAFRLGSRSLSQIFDEKGNPRRRQSKRSQALE